MPKFKSPTSYRTASGALCNWHLTCTLSPSLPKFPSPHGMPHDNLCHEPGTAGDGIHSPCTTCLFDFVDWYHLPWFTWRVLPCLILEVSAHCIWSTFAALLPYIQHQLILKAPLSLLLVTAFHSYHSLWKIKAFVASSYWSDLSTRPMNFLYRFTMVGASMFFVIQ